jgi:hypothetical protein
MSVRTAQILALLVGVSWSLGCRTVWIHPEATPQKYSEDVNYCQTEQRPTWKICMYARGWTNVTRNRDKPPFATK